jgi:hypothetical protein
VRGHDGIADAQEPLLKGQMLAGGHHHDRILCKVLSIGSFPHRHAGHSAEQLGQEAGGMRVHMGHNDKGHTTVQRHVGKERLERF